MSDNDDSGKNRRNTLGGKVSNNKKIRRIDDLNNDLNLLSKRVSRRQAITAGVGVAAGVAAGLVVGGAAGYLAGGAGRARSGQTATQTQTVTDTVSGTGSGGAGEPQSITVQTFSSSNTADTSQFVANLYQQQHPGTTISFQLIAEAQANSALLTALPTAPPPDIIYNSSQPAINQQVIDPGYALELDPYIAAYGWDKSTNLLDVYKYNGHYYWFPWAYIYFGNIYYNIDMFQKYGIEAPPQTLSDLDNIAATLTKNGITPMVHGYQTEPGWFANVVSDWLLNSMTPADYQTFWTAYGTDLKTSNFASRSIKWTDDQIVSAFTIAQDWAKNVLAPGTVSMTDAAAVSAFTAQQAGMYMVGSWGATGLEQPVGNSFKFGFWPITTPPTNGGGNQRMVIFAQTYVIMNKTKSPDLCADYLNSFLSVPSQLDFWNTQGLFPGDPAGPVDHHRSDTVRAPEHGQQPGLWVLALWGGRDGDADPAGERHRLGAHRPVDPAAGVPDPGEHGRQREPAGG